MSDKIYVIVSDEQAATFTGELATIVREYDLKPNVGKSNDDKGRTLHVLDAKGSDVRLRSENVLLSGQEDPSKCGAHSEPYPDPGQYFISVSAPRDLVGNEGPNELLRRISSDLRKRGYAVASKPKICSAYME
tara:strand:+ start:3286 stop:3684 length:399 start_codon:yes stop_codon:yes gene_type:complete